ncbi:FG-GAP-like repeat-containing protein [Gammaproteobacteria bacterium]|nr:FG-GAP-like repeat-containing protein [Gammaproteobacteria bacterium]
MSSTTNPYATPSTSNTWVEGISTNYHWQNNSGSSYTTDIKYYVDSTFYAWEVSLITEVQANFAAVCNVTFTETNTGSVADIYWDDPSGGGSAYGMAEFPRSALNVYNTDYQSTVSIYYQNYENSGTQYMGSFDSVTYLHELGHAMGLAHPHDTGSSSSVFAGVSSNGDTGDYDMNQGIYTTMTYVDGWYTGGSQATPSNNTYGYQMTPMALDIAALQNMYGANTTYANGTNTYTLDTSNNTGTGYQSIWDTGGTDTITNASSSSACVIDLRAATLGNEVGGGGYVSYVGGIYAGYTIANNVVIENAIGGSGNDTITGNSAANTLTGGSGNDTLTGGTGNDTYYVDSTDDTVTENSGEGTDTVSSSATFTLSSNVEDLTLTGSSAINGTGNSDANTITGNSAANTLTGGAGNDTLTGGAGNDTLTGGAGDDTLTGGTGNDVIIGGAGTNSAVGGAGDDFVLINGSHGSAQTISSSSVAHSTTSVSLSGIEGKAFLDVNLSGSFQAGALNFADISGDGLVDIIMETSDHDFYFSSGTGSGASGGLGTASVGLQHGGPSGFTENQVQFTDMNGDGKYDSVYQGIDNRFWVNYGQDVGFSGASLVAEHGGGFNTAQVQYADTNGDSKSDLIFQGTDNRFWVQLGESDGFGGATLAATHGGGFNPEQVQYSDLNGDGKIDLLFQGSDNRFWANLGVASGFGGATLVAEHGGPFVAGAVQYGDVDGDGKSDLMFQGSDNRFWVNLGTSNGFGAAQLAAVVTHDDFNIEQWQLVDMNNDDALDLMYQGDDNSVWYYEATGNGTFETGEQATNFGGDFQGESVGYGDLNGDNLGDIIFQDENNDVWTSLQNYDWFA